MDITRIHKPRCFMLYALAPASISPSEANQVINRISADQSLPLALYHDHFIGQIGGVIVFYAETAEEREALQKHLPSYLDAWEYNLHPLIFSYSPAAFDEQIAYTLRAYRETDWEQLQNEKRPSYGNPRDEAETGQEG